MSPLTGTAAALAARRAAIQARFAAADPAALRVMLTASPVRLAALGLVLMLLCVAAGTVTSLAATGRRAELGVLLRDAEPAADAAQRLYSSLSIADAAASTAFISGGIEPVAVRNRYLQAIGEAAAGLARADGAGGNQQQLTGVATGLPVYSGLVETARTANRSGLPVGAAYLGEASALMQSRLLPLAESVQAQQSAAVATTQDRNARLPWTALAVLAGVLAWLGAAQYYLARRWRRRINPGLLAATLVMLGLLLWTAVAGAISAYEMRAARHTGTDQLALLTESRIRAQQARSDEMLLLARRDSTGEYAQAYERDMGRLRAVLARYAGSVDGEYAARATEALRGWGAAHTRMSEALARGDFAGASAVAIGAGKDDAATYFAALDAALDDGIGGMRAQSRAHMSGAVRSFGVLPAGGPLLALAAAVAAAAGIWPRLREYR